MLVLSRDRGEKLRIGINGEVTIEVVEVRGDRVRLGITAPASVPVHREEVFLSIKKKEEGDQDGWGW